MILRGLFYYQFYGKDAPLFFYFLLLQQTSTLNSLLYGAKRYTQIINIIKQETNNFFQPITKKKNNQRIT